MSVVSSIFSLSPPVAAMLAAETHADVAMMDPASCSAPCASALQQHKPIKDWNCGLGTWVRGEAASLKGPPPMAALLAPATLDTNAEFSSFIF